MKGLDEVFAIVKMCRGFPTIVFSVIAFLFDKVLILVTVFAAVENGFDFVLSSSLSICIGGGGGVL
jgi:hypothetical protein